MIREERRLLPIMEKLAACLCTELEAAGFTMCFCGLLPGGDVALDFCGDGCNTEGCGGQAWVRAVSVFPSADFPDPDVTPVRCNSPLAAQLEVGHSMCAPQPDNDGTPPGVQVQYEATFRQMASMDAMWRAIACCLEAEDYSVGTYTPIPAGGGCLVAAWTVTVGI